MTMSVESTADDVRDRGERTRPCRVDRARPGAGRFRVTVDGDAAIVDAQRERRRRRVAAVSGRRRMRRLTVQFAPGTGAGRDAGVPRRTDASRVASTAAAPARAAADSGAGGHGEQKVVAPMPGTRRPRARRAGRRGRGAPAGRGRRGDEDGERAALAQGRAGQGRRRRRPAPPSRPGACWWSSSEPRRRDHAGAAASARFPSRRLEPAEPPPTRRRCGIPRCGVARRFLVALVAVVIVSTVDDRPRARR